MKSQRSIRLPTILLMLAMTLDQLSATAVADDWMRWELGTLGLSVVLPGKPKMDRLPLPDAAQQIIADHMAYVYSDNEMGVFITYVLLTRVTQKQIDALPAIVASMAISRLAGNSKVSSIRSSTEQVGSKVIIKGSFDRDGTTVEAQGFVTTRGRSLWAIFVLCTQDDESGCAKARRVVESVKLGSQ